MTREVYVATLWDETPEIRCFELRPVDCVALPTAEPGAHIDVHIGRSLTRQYSLWNGPDEGDAYFIGVKREPQSRGGSIGMHDLSVGDRLTISLPRNNFRLHAHEGQALLFAGGIGITPLLAMARHLEARKAEFHLHLFSRSKELAPFASRLLTHPDMSVHCGLVPPALDARLADLLEPRTQGSHLYICGPAPFMALAVAIAIERNWPQENIHLEHFAAVLPPEDPTARSFEVVAKRSGKTVVVEPKQTITQALISAGVDIFTSCEQGVCGTCVTAVLEGEPDHRDQYFNAAEHSSGKVITPCVSRCKGKRLVLDI